MKKNRNWKIFFAAAAAAIIITSVVILIRDNGEPPYITEKITRGNIQAVCTATGTVNPLTTVLVGTQVSGRIKAIHADYNSAVKNGQLIAEIDPSTFQAQLEQAQANLFSARANLKQAESTSREAERNLNRSKELFASNVIGQSDLDTVVTKYEVAKSGVGVANAQVVQAEAAYEYADTNLRYTRIISPVDGIVISRNVDVGQTVAATFQTPTLFTIAQDLKKMQINTNVDEADIGKIMDGQKAEFTVDAYQDMVFSGYVKQVRNSPVIVQNVVTYDVVISVNNSDLKLKPGMTANVSIIVGTRENVLMIPNSALRFIPKDLSQGDYDNNSGPCVWIIDQDKIVPVKLTIGIDDYNYTELVSGNLHEGLDVVVGLKKKKD